MQCLNLETARLPLRSAARLYLLLALLLMLAAPLAAQESTHSKAGESATQSDKASAETSEASKKESGTQSEKPADPAQKLERFDPSEEISKDLSVSFPVDI